MGSGFEKTQENGRYEWSQFVANGRDCPESEQHRGMSSCEKGQVSSSYLCVNGSVLGYICASEYNLTLRTMDREVQYTLYNLQGISELQGGAPLEQEDLVTLVQAI